MNEEALQLTPFPQPIHTLLIQNNCRDCNGFNLNSVLIYLNFLFALIKILYRNALDRTSPYEHWE